VRVWFALAGNGDAKARIDRCKKQVRCFAGSRPGDTYVFILFDFEPKELVVETYVLPEFMLDDLDFDTVEQAEAYKRELEQDESRVRHDLPTPHIYEINGKFRVVAYCPVTVVRHQE
jgi:hypothetical protein